jgi:TorA maturation chaperone TorD
MRTLSVEAVMDLASEILWPEADEQPVEIDEFDSHRSNEYSLLAMLLSRPPDAATLNRIAKLRGDTTSLGLAHLALAQAAGNVSAERIAREYFTLFIGVGRGELLPYGSYYHTGFLNERPLARLRGDLRAYGIERAEGQVEPEDHAATLCEIMAGMAGGQFPTTAGMQHEFFEKHLGSWIGRFFADLEQAEAAEFYRQVGTLGRLFLRPRQKRSGFRSGQSRVIRRTCDAYGRQDVTRTSPIPSCVWRRSGGRRRVAACSGGESR